ncbi:MAG: branched-chain amino acid ABC transporter permease [Bacillota bacterium]
MRVPYPRSKQALTLTAAFLVVAWANGNLEFAGIPGWGSYAVRIINLCAINAVLAMSLNLICGFTGQFSLGHAGFMALGAYVTALLTMPPALKETLFYITPIWEPLHYLTLPFAPALFLSGLITGLVSLLVGLPALRLKGDYLGIATLGFAEIIRLILQNVKRLTNGALGLKGIFLSFFISSFLAGVGGGLLASLLTTIDPVMFKFPLTFQVLLTVVLGGMGSLTGSVLAAGIVTYLMEFLRIVEEPHYLSFMTIRGIPGLRMVIFSLALVVVVVWYPRGLLGDKELSLESLRTAAGRLRKLASRRRAAE